MRLSDTIADSSKKIVLKPTSNKAIMDELITNNKSSFNSWNYFNSVKNYRFKDSKSGNLQFLSPDKNLRLTVNNSLTSTNRDLGYTTNTINVINANSKLDSSLYNNYVSSSLDWVNKDVYSKISRNNLTLPLHHSPNYSNNIS
jgi:hypothetical protein